MAGADVVVLGSANADLVVEVGRRPHGGETVLGSDLVVRPGGKGANQAAAAARAGAGTTFVGCVGEDAYGQLATSALRSAGVDVSYVRTSERATGTAVVLLTPDGENSIVVSPGANTAVDGSLADAAAVRAGAAGLLVVSLEIPADVAWRAVGRAFDAGARVLLNAAPARAVEDDVLGACDPLVVNEHEAAIVLGGSDGGPHDLARELLGRGARSVVITLGAAGSVVADAKGVDAIPAHRVEAVDTTGAGDAFVGATACELSRGASLRDAVRFATAMSAISVGAKGAQDSYPDRAEVESFLRRLG